MYHFKHLLNHFFEMIKKHIFQILLICKFNPTKIAHFVDLYESLKNNDEICQRCLDLKADWIIMSCGNIGCCHKYLNKWFKNKYHCPYCQIEHLTFRNIHEIIK